MIKHAHRISAALMFIAIALGAFGAHALKPQLEASGHVDTWKTATVYFLIHGATLFFLSWKRIPPKAPFILFTIGILFFSGSLYTLSLTKLTWVGPITPLGGLCFLIGWAWLACTGRGG